MIQYLLETLVFQLIFLLVYDLFLKRETFFQWNRLYLLLAFAASLLLPWIKIEALKTTVSSEAVFYPGFLLQLDGAEVGQQVTAPSFWQLLSWQEWLYAAGAGVMLVLFALKLFKIQHLKAKGAVKYYKNYTKVLVAKSEVAFSFFKNVFLGDDIPKTKEPQILAHELVHIKQWHSLDLCFFEVMRIALWFNPLVYVFQSRMAELHEFIADAEVAKAGKNEQYQLLLSEVFQTQNLSFVNQFFKKSLIKKRIVMLTKEKSKAILQLKYVLLLPLVLGMLTYTACETERNNEAVKAIEQGEFQELLKQYDEINLEIEKALNAEMTDDEIKNLLDKAVAVQKQIIENFYAEFSGIKDFSVFGDAHQKALERLGGSAEFTLVVKDLNDPTPAEKAEYDAKLEKLYKMQGRNYLIMKDQSSAVRISVENGHIANVEDSRLNKNAATEPFMTVDEVPIFPGCEDASDKRACFQEKIQNHIIKHFNYPKEAQDKNIQGRVSILFVIDADGNINDVRMRGPHEFLEKEARRIIEKLPKMTPGRHQGKNVNVPFSIPITFKLNTAASGENENFKKDIAASLLNVLNSSEEHDLLPTDVGLGDEIRELTEKYDQLVIERERLLKSTNDQDVLIINLDEQLQVLKLRLKEELLVIGKVD